jgi:hypothetical protein
MDLTDLRYEQWILQFTYFKEEMNKTILSLLMALATMHVLTIMGTPMSPYTSTGEF